MKVELNLVELSNTLLQHHTNSYVVDEGEGYYDFDYPVATIKHNDATISLVSDSVVANLVKELIKKISDNTTKMLQPTFKELQRLQSEVEKLEKENLELAEINQDYKRNYGEYIAPSLILGELYNGGRVAKDTQLIQKSKWKIKYLKSPKHSKGVSYWLNLFEDWGIFKSYGICDKFANLTHCSALDYVYHKINKLKLKEIENEQ